LIIGLLLFANAARTQVLISILLGDKLNSGKIEFGLEGGATGLLLKIWMVQKTSQGLILVFILISNLKIHPG
jgi:hypothetical protein